MRIELLTGETLATAIPELARLRITVFREWPYLYDGNAAFESKYLRVYQDCPDSLIVIARTDDGTIVGTSTALPLEAADEGFSEPFALAGFNPAAVLYLGESVLLPEFRGQGVGKAFFRERLAHARSLGRTMTAFCAIDRDETDPRRPMNYRPLDAFWSGLGFVKQPNLQAKLAWKEINQSGEHAHTLTFWTRPQD